jgi:DNA-binding CsgD family transcriptional regulator
VTEATSLNQTQITAMAHALSCLGQPSFPQAFCRLGAAHSGAQAAHLSAFFQEARPVEIFSTRQEPAAIAALRTYFDLAYLLDPFHQLFRRSPGDRVDGLREIAPDDFKRSDYYKMFFRDMNLVDECGLMLVIQPDAALFLSMGVHDARRLRLAPLRAMLPVLGALARRHWTVLTPQRLEGTGRLAAQLDAAFAAFGDSVLSPREAEITRMILQGHSTKAIALIFDNSPETIKVHRKRIYTKLGLATQGALLPLFLDALRSMPPGAKGDPLQYLPR